MCLCIKYNRIIEKYNIQDTNSEEVSNFVRYNYVLYRIDGESIVKKKKLIELTGFKNVFTI